GGGPGGGAGPGAHGFIGDTRLWNVKHPNAYASQLEQRRLPIAGSEALGDDARHLEAVLLAIRLRSGLPVAELSPSELARVDAVVADGLLMPEADRLVLTDRGRLLADGIVRSLLDD
ncbi:MAG: coproporphyrinogen III oxidase, partial [Mycobacterium sp.]